MAGAIGAVRVLLKIPIVLVDDIEKKLSRLHDLCKPVNANHKVPESAFQPLQ